MKSLAIILFALVAVNARITPRADNMELDWWEHGVFYQIYPKSFKDSDGNGVGDLKGIIDKLDHLKELGVTGTWLSPIFESPQVDGGYDISDFRKVDPMFGTNAQLKDLFAKAKTLGIKVILDFVPNHSSDKHEWFVKSANNETGFADYYVWRECPLSNTNDPNSDRILPNNWISVFHGPAWTYHEGRKQCYLHQFAKEQPDLNYRNEKVEQEMMDILKFWLTEGADGFRIDAINHMFEDINLGNESYVDPAKDHSDYNNLKHDKTMNLQESYDFIYKVRKMMDDFAKDATEKHTRLMMTEAYASIPQQVLWYGKDNATRGAHIPFNFELISELNKDSSAADFKKAIDSWMNEMPKWGVVANWVLGNHDRSRFGSRYGQERHESLAMMTMMLPGVNVVYNGEEILMLDNTNISWKDTQDPQACNAGEENYQKYTRDPVRTPFQWDNSTSAGFSTNATTWLPVHPNYLQVNLAAQNASEKSTFKLYKQLIETRNKYHTLQMGNFASKSLSTSVFGFTRTHEGMKTIAVFVNLGKATKVSLKDLIGDEYSGNTKAEILVANTASKLSLGSLSKLEEIELGDYDAIVIEVSSATKLAISFLLVVCSVIKIIF